MELLKNDKENEQKSGQSIDVKANLSTKELNSADAWKLGFSYPLIACASTERADEIIVSSMASRMNN